MRLVIGTAILLTPRLPAPHHTNFQAFRMYTTKGIEAIATITELRSRTAELIDEASKYEGIMIQKNNEPLAVLVSYDKYLKLMKKMK